MIIISHFEKNVFFCTEWSKLSTEWSKNYRSVSNFDHSVQN